MVYTTSELLNLIKQDMGLRDLPRTITDQDMLDRLQNSALKEFSIRCPYRVESYIGVNEKIDAGMWNRRTVYRIPKTFYMGSSILQVNRVDPIGCDTYGEFFDFSVAPDVLLSTLADYKLYATLQNSMYPALTFNFRKPDILEIYNGWIGSYVVELSIIHDSSLATIPDGASSAFRQLALLDMEEYFYNSLKRIEDINTGVGQISLKVDQWSNAGQEKRDLLKQWDEDANLDVDAIMRF